MQVIYKKSIIDLMDEAIESSIKISKEIDKFILDQFEYVQFGKEYIYINTGIGGLAEGLVLPSVLKYRNIPVELVMENEV